MHRSDGCLFIPVPDDIAFEAIKTSLDAVPPGVKMLLKGIRVVRVIF